MSGPGDGSGAQTDLERTRAGLLADRLLLQEETRRRARQSGGQAMDIRRIHHIGTTPLDSPSDAVELMLDYTGEAMRSCPEEATEGRQDWIIPQLIRRCHIPEIKCYKRVHYYDRARFRLWNTCVCRPRDGSGQSLTPDVLELPWATYARASLPLVVGHAMDREMPWVKYQAGIPSPLNMAAFTWGPWAMKYYHAEVAAAVREVQRITTLALGKVVFQIECPVETCLVHWAPAAKREQVADWCARLLCEFVARCPVGSEFIIHECAGAPRGFPVVRLRDTDVVTTLANAITRHWPEGRVLDAVHMPFGDVATPAPVDEGYYQALGGLTVPEGTDVIAGLANTRDDYDRQRAALWQAEVAAGRSLGVAQPCGAGRDTSEDPATAKGNAVLMMRRLVGLAAAPLIVGGVRER